jgi:hypothetical protein
LPFYVSGAVARIGASFSVTPGSCSVATDARAIGLARPSGFAHVVCCM